MSQDEWASTFPAFSGLFSNHTTALLRPFSLFSISSLFRSSPSPPLTSLLESLDVLAQSAITDVPSVSATVKALTGLQSFVTQLQEYVNAHQPKLEDEEILNSLAFLLSAYINGVAIASRVAFQVVEEEEDGKKERDMADIREALKQCLEGVFVVRSLLIPTQLHDFAGSSTLHTTMRAADDQLLGSIFPPSETRFHLLASLLSHPREMLQSFLAQRTIHPFAGSKTKFTKTSTPAQRVPDEDEVLYVLELLGTFVTGLEGIDILLINSVSNSINMVKGKGRAKSKKAIKAEQEEDIRRPLRIAMEAKVMRCDLALSMATRKMEDIKFRAAARAGQAAEREDEGVHSQAKQEEEDENEEKDESEEEEEEDIKPSLEGEDAHDRIQIRSPEAEEADALRGIKWESIAEDALIECLQGACHLLDEGRGEVLSSHVEAMDWLGFSGVNSAEERRVKSKSPSIDGTESDSESGSEDEEENDSESEQGNTHPCPLRTIFRLHERFVEQRLGVWLHLPASQRGKMGTFMRGEDRKVGIAWDNMGLGLMLEFDSSTLLDYGLDADKLDKWLEIAAARNAKKIKRKGRRTI